MGAPLVAREVEHGTHRLVWTQGVSRRHWVLVKAGLVGAVTLSAAVVYGLGMSWWLTPLSQAGLARNGPLVFDMQGVAPVGYTLFAVALGIFAGTIWQKVMPAMAVTLVGFVGLRLVVTILARRHFQPPSAVTYALDSAGAPPDLTHRDWVIGRGIRDATGRMVGPRQEILCPVGDTDCATRPEFGPGASNWVQFQPDSQFWLIQGIETGIFAGLAALLLYLAVRRIRRLA